MISDEQLAVRVRAGDETAARQLLDRFTGLAITIAAPYYDRSSDVDDIRQEALIGVYKAARDYDASRGLNFVGFVRLVVQRQVITFVKTATRRKHSYLTNSVRVAVNDDGEEIGAIDTAAAPNADPADVVVAREELAAVADVVANRLSPLEHQTLEGIANGETMRELQVRLGYPLCETSLDSAGRPRPKVVENAFDRVKKKIARAIAEAPDRPLDVAA